MTQGDEEMKRKVMELVKYVTQYFILWIDETVTINELLERCHFVWISKDITSKTFPRPRNAKKYRKKINIFHFDEHLSSEEVISRMSDLGYKPATIWHLLYVSIKNPDIQRRFPVVSLGSSCLLDGLRYIPCLPKKETGEYEIFLEEETGPDKNWSSYCHFIGVLK